jgi:Flp pilus assembly pilin Flp
MTTKLRVRRLLRDTRGATMVEYSLLLLMILVASAPGLKIIGSHVRDAFGSAVAVFGP